MSQSIRRRLLPDAGGKWGFGDMHQRVGLNRHPEYGCGKVLLFGEGRLDLIWDGQVDAGNAFCGRVWCTKRDFQLCEECAIKHGFKW